MTPAGPHPDTDALIADLSLRAVPVRRRLHAPLLRAAGIWLLAFALLVLLLSWRGARGDIASHLANSRVALGLCGALLTSMLGAVAACMLAVPDRSRAWLLLPLPALALWLGSIGYGCFTAWIGIAPGMVTAEEALRCLTTTLICGVPVSALVLWLLRRGAPVHPGLATLAGGLAAAGVTAAALGLIHSIDPSAMVLLWNFGIVAVLVGLQGSIGRAVLRRP